MKDSKMDAAKPKKMVSRNVAIALGIICIVLGAVLSATILEISPLYSRVNDLTDALNLMKYVTLVEYQKISQTAGNYTSWVFNPESIQEQEVAKCMCIESMPSNWSIKYAGKLDVEVPSSTTNNTYIRVIYSPYYDNQEDVGISGGAMVIPVIPTSNIEVRVGNTNANENATETVIITYQY